MGCAADYFSNHRHGRYFLAAGWVRRSAFALSPCRPRTGHHLPASDCPGARLGLSSDLGFHDFDCETCTQPKFLGDDPLELAEKLAILFARRRVAGSCPPRDRTLSSHAKRTAHGPLLPDSR